jgi:Zn-dependent protease
LATGFGVFSLVLALIVIVASLTFHEAAHAWTADKLGDSTARYLGRISLNPLVHIDPIGTVLLPLVAYATGAPLIGWAKPVPVNIRALRNGRRDFMLVAAAGPASNLLIALVASIGVRALTGPAAALSDAGGGTIGFCVYEAFTLNLLLAVFNMIPVPPLDGGNVLAGLLPPNLANVFDQLRPYGIFILYGLLLTGALPYIIGPPYSFLARLLTL